MCAHAGRLPAPFACFASLYHLISIPCHTRASAPSFPRCRGHTCPQWAAEDPYVAAGLFADQLVAPLLTYAVPCTKIGFQAEMADEAIARAEAEAIV